MSVKEFFREKVGTFNTRCDLGGNPVRKADIIWERVSGLLPHQNLPERTAETLRGLVSAEAIDDPDSFLLKGTTRLNQEGKDKAKAIYQKARKHSSSDNLRQASIMTRTVSRANSKLVSRWVRDEVKAAWKDAGRKTRGNLQYKEEVQKALLAHRGLKQAKLEQRIFTSLAQQARIEQQSKERSRVKAAITDMDLGGLRRELESQGKRVPSEALLKNIIVTRRLAGKEAFELPLPAEEETKFIEQAIQQRTAQLDQETGRRLRSLGIEQGKEYLKRLKERMPKSRLIQAAAAVGLITVFYLSATAAYHSRFSQEPARGNENSQVWAKSPFSNQTGERVVFLDTKFGRSQPPTESSNESGPSGPEPEEKPKTQTAAPPPHEATPIISLSPLKKDAQLSISLLRYLDGNSNFLSEEEKRQFVDEVIQIAKDLDPDNNNPELANDLMDVMNFESGFSNKPNRYTGAVGAIHFTPRTARALGTSIEELKRMSLCDQLKYVKRYFSPYRGQLKTKSDVYMAVLWPAAVGKGPNHVLFRRGTVEYAQNADAFDPENKGYITINDTLRAIQRETVKQTAKSIS